MAGIQNIIKKQFLIYIYNQKIVKFFFFFYFEYVNVLQLNGAHLRKKENEIFYWRRKFSYLCAPRYLVSSNRWYSLFIFKRIYINVQIKIELIFQIFLHLYLHFLDINSFYFLFLIRVISTYAVASKKIKYRAQEERVHNNPILKI